MIDTSPQILQSVFFSPRFQGRAHICRRTVLILLANSLVTELASADIIWTFHKLKKTCVQFK